MKIDFKYVMGILGTIILGLSTWTLVSIVDLKEKSSMIQGELLGINKDIGRVYNYINSKWILTLHYFINKTMNTNAGNFQEYEYTQEYEECEWR